MAESSEIGGSMHVEEDGSSAQKEEWIKEQELLKRRLVLTDDFSWKLIITSSHDEDSVAVNSSGILDQSKLRYVGGVDLSFSKLDESIACAALVVMDLEIMQVVYEDFDTVKLTMPYIAGFLAFRETPVLLGLLQKMALKEPALYPQLLMVDGNGILHPRGFGLASHLGVLADIPTIGVGKNLHHVDGLTNLKVRNVVAKSNLQAGDVVPLIGSTGQVWGAALHSHEGCQKPIFISIGHRISLDTAVAVVRCCCLHRVPEPVRQADLRSRDRLRLRIP
ncbi:unnamed protein product [Sphagnum troendelagicum]|uniref:Endonuclease V n=1 Tax=Sphagnum troendelagicum TaxID=128251 RepID=A0ABP0U929_9BRYO